MKLKAKTQRELGCGSWGAFKKPPHEAGNLWGVEIAPTDVGWYWGNGS